MSFFSQLIKDAYLAKRDALRVVLGRSSFHFPHVVDIDWRLDYHIRSSGIERIDEPVWVVTLKTVERNGENGSIQFTCNRDEMQDLLARLKDAMSAFQKNAE